MQYTLYIIILFLDMSIAGVLAAYAWRHREVTGAFSFFLLIMSIAAWSFTSGLSAISYTDNMAHFWTDEVQFIIIALLPVFFLKFALEYTGYYARLTPRRTRLLYVIPMITILINWLGPAEWFYEVREFWHPGNGNYYFVEGAVTGTWFLVHTLYSYGLILYGLYLIYVRIRMSASVYRNQAILLFVGAVVPLMFNMVTTVRVSGQLTVDYTSIGFTVTGLVWGWALFRYRLLDIMPVAHEAVVMSMDDAVFVLDKQRRVVELNPAAAKVARQEKPKMLDTLEMVQTEVIGNPIANIFPKHRHTFERLLRLHDASTEITWGEQYFDLHVSTLYLRNQQESGRLVVLRDITARKRAEEERERLIEELNAYAHTVAHDLKNPLGVVMTYVDLLGMNGADEVKREHYRQIIARTGRKMVHIIDELLLMASVRDRDTIEIENLDMRAIVKDVRERFQQQIEESGASFVLVGADEWPVARGYAPWVEEIMANYVSNALKYGGTPPLVEIGAMPQSGNGQVRFQVRDNGEGMTREEQEKIFGAFTRLDQIRAEGHGLGLSIVRRIAEKLSGEVGVTSEKGKGSTFYLVLPGQAGQ